MNFRKIAGLLFEMDNTGSPEATAPQASPPQQPQTQTPQVSIPATPMVSSMGINQDMVDFLTKAIEEANLQGFDYLEFKQAVGKMMNVPMTEQQRFMAVFATAQAMGVTIQSLTDSVDHYLTVIEKQRDGFMGSASHATQKEVDTRMAQVATNEKQIQEATQKINELTTFITQTQQENLKITQEANSEKMKIDNSIASFEATFNMMAGRLKEDKQKLVSYLTTQTSPA
jgi:hypothetical protein